MSYIILDLDNCISDDSWRIPLIRWSEPNLTLRYHDYHSRCGADRAANHDLWLGCRDDIIIITARPLSVRRVTERWLASNGVEWKALIMREEDNHEPSHVFKQHRLLALPTHMRRHIVRAYDDRPEVCFMYEQHGVRAQRRFIHEVNCHPYAKH